LYSLGATAYHALAGRPPIEGDTPVAVLRGHLEQPPRETRDTLQAIEQRGLGRRVGEAGFGGERFSGDGRADVHDPTGLDCGRRRTGPDVLYTAKPRLRLPLPAGMPFRLEVSTNLLDWEPVVCDVAVEDAASFVEDDMQAQPQRFFRVVQEFGDLDNED
jgi:hypothetical protein